MAVNTVSGATTQSTQTAADRGMSGLSGDDFMNLLIKQLQYQDPLQPMTNEEMMKQMATIRELEMNTRLSDRLEQLTDQQRFGSSAALIGKHVSGTIYDDQGNAYPRAGVVRSVLFTTEGEVLLELDNDDLLPLASLEQVTEPEAFANSTADEEPDTESN